LVVTGPEAKLKSRMSAILPKARVKYAGLLPTDEYLKLKASCDFALNITEEPYTLSHVIFEYVASGLPVISSRQAVVEGVFGDSVLYVDDSNPSTITSKVKDLLGSPSMLEAQREKAKVKFSELKSMRTEEITRLKSLAFQPLG
jgi:glycosyltransferase involved in cell wall biosynthesis